MLSNHETRERMRCKLVENLQFDSHLEASRLRDYSGYSTNYEAIAEVPHDSIKNSVTHEVTENKNEFIDEKNSKETENLTNKLKLNKEAINKQLNEDIIADEEFHTQQQNQNQIHHDSKKIEIQEEKNYKIEPSNNFSSSKSSKNSSNVNLYESGQIKTPQEEYYEAFLQLEEKEKLIISSECELITVTRIIKGRFELTNKYIYFFDTYSSFYFENNLSLNESNFDSVQNIGVINGNLTTGYNSLINHTSFSTNQNYNVGFSCHDFDILNDFKISLTQLKEVQLRRYNLRRSALEFFVINGSNFFINFNKNVSSIFRHFTIVLF